jgi:hypothetical protein
MKLTKDIFTTDTPLSNEERAELYRRKTWTQDLLVQPSIFVPKHVRNFANSQLLKDIPEFLKRQAE